MPAKYSHTRAQEEEDEEEELTLKCCCPSVSLAAAAAAVCAVALGHLAALVLNVGRQFCLSFPQSPCLGRAPEPKTPRHRRVTVKCRPINFYTRY